MLTTLIAIATVAVSFLCFRDGQLFDKLSLRPYRMVRHGEWHRIVTHGFVHADWVHLGFGGWAFLALYFGGMAAASVSDVVRYRNNPAYASIGASGAVSAVLFSAIFLNPWDKILLFAVIPIPGIIFGLLYLAYCQYMARRGGDNINHSAHFYGAVFGFIFPAILHPQLIRAFLSHF